MKRIFVLLVVTITGMTQSVKSQNVAVKSNVLADAFLNPNLGIEIGLASKWTLDVTGQFNAWMLSHNRHWKHWAIQPEVRYWFCDRFSGHFVLTFMEDSITSEVLTEKSISLVRMLVN